MRILPAAVATVAVLVLAAACAADTEGASETAATFSSTTTTSTSSSTTTSAAGTTGDFCTDAARFVNDRSVTDISGFSAEFFVAVDRRLSAMVDAAPASVRSDVETLRAEFSRIDQALAGFDYDLDDPALATALEQVDNEAMLAATASIEQSLVDDCGAAGTTTDPRQVADIQEAFGVDQALAECLNRELGDIANIDSSQLTPELIARSVCGTSLLVLLSGAQPDG